jgi:beta-glucosidase
VANADVVVAAVGLTSDLEGEEMPVKVDGFAGGDKTSLDLPADQRALLESAKALGKPLVVVALNGSAIDLSWARTMPMPSWRRGIPANRAVLPWPGALW